MNFLKLAIPAVALFTLLPSTSQAQFRLPCVSTSYCVQVKYEFWRNGSTYWATEFESTSLEDAELMADLLESAMDDGSIRDILNVGFDWIVVDVRIQTKYEFLQLAPSRWQGYQPLIRSPRQLSNYK